MLRRLAGLLVAGALLAALLPAGAAAVDPVKRPSAPLPDSVDQLKLAEPVSLPGTRPRPSRSTSACADPPAGNGSSCASRRAPAIERVDAGQAEQGAALATARAQQAGVIAKAQVARPERPGARPHRQGVQRRHARRSTPRASPPSPADRSVVAIVPVKDYTLHLSATVPYVGGATVQKLGYKGPRRQGRDPRQRDRLHPRRARRRRARSRRSRPRTAETTDDPKNTTLDGLFPTARVKGGYDFVGEAWPNGDEAPDPDPIDSPDSGTDLGVAMGTDGGHGTHVADIIGGTKGMAPGRASTP